MAIGTTLANLVIMVRNEARLSSSTSQGIDHLAYIKQLLKRTNNVLCDSYEWEHMRLLRTSASVALVANQQFYTFPATLNTDRPFVAYRLINGVWLRMEPVISPENYNIIDSYNGGRGIPEAWDWNGATGFEVWPVPSAVVAGDVIAFEGTKQCGAMTADADTADMDDILLSLQVAGEILAGNNQEAAAKTTLGAANVRLSQIRASKSNASRIVIGGFTSGSGRMPRHPDFVTAR